MDDQKDDLRVQTPRRVEILTGRGYRQRWSDAMKATIVVESLKPGIVVTELARRYGACPSQVHGWRKDAREGRLILPAAPAFAEVVVAPHQVSALGAKSRAYKPQPRDTGATIEIASCSVQVRVGAGADPTLVAAIVRALKDAT
jgi:transposase